MCTRKFTVRSLLSKSFLSNKLYYCNASSLSAASVLFSHTEQVYWDFTGYFTGLLASNRTTNTSGPPLPPCFCCWLVALAPKPKQISQERTKHDDHSIQYTRSSTAESVQYRTEYDVKLIHVHVLCTEYTV